MRTQCRLHGVSQPGQRQPRFGVPGVATSITAVNMLIGIQEEHHHGHVVIEFKQIQIDAGNFGPPDADELICEVLYLFKTNNLLVKFKTITSRDAAKDNHQRPVRRAGLANGLCVIERPAIFDCFRPVVVIAAVLSERTSADERDDE
jgi:hypothetical protein